MDAKHTPGPWRWISDQTLWGANNDSVLEATDDGRAYGMHSALIGHHYDAETAAANRALISAAPDMFDALVGLCDGLADAFTNSGPMTAVELLNAVRQQTESARAAIAKARGA